MKVYAPGTEIGQYRVLSDPLMGGMGVVYICHDLTHDRPVALKTFKPEYLPDRAARPALPPTRPIGPACWGRRARRGRSAARRPGRAVRFLHRWLHGAVPRLCRTALFRDAARGVHGRGSHR